MTALCGRPVHWYDADLTTSCLRPAGHDGLHRDGLYWFDQHGLRAPRDPAPAAPIPDEMALSAAAGLPVATCPGCHRPYCLNTDGCLRFHRAGPASRRTCPGSHRRPGMAVAR